MTSSVKDKEIKGQEPKLVFKANIENIHHSPEGGSREQLQLRVKGTSVDQPNKNDDEAGFHKPGPVWFSETCPAPSLL